MSFWYVLNEFHIASHSLIGTDSNNSSIISKGVVGEHKPFLHAVIAFNNKV